MVEIDTQRVLAQKQVGAGCKLFLQGLVELCGERPCFKSSGRQLVAAHKVGIVGATVVGREEKQVVAAADSGV